MGGGGGGGVRVCVCDMGIQVPTDPLELKLQVVVSHPL